MALFYEDFRVWAMGMKMSEMFRLSHLFFAFNKAQVKFDTSTALKFYRGPLQIINNDGLSH